MVLYLKMNEKAWAYGDYTNSASFDLSGTVYSDDKLSSTVNITSYTPTLYFIDYEGNRVYSTTTGITVSAGSGVFSILFSQDNTPVLQGYYRVRLLLESTGNRLTCVGVNGSDDMFFDL